MSVETYAVLGAKWFWDQFGKNLADKALGEVKNKWTKFHWDEAENKYRERMYEIYSVVRILGYPNPIQVEEIYTEVYVQDKISATLRYDLLKLQTTSSERESVHIKQERKPLVDLATTKKRIFLWGLPGSGKTTFLKHLVLLTCKGKIGKTPIFVSLKELADSHLDLLDFIILQFDICQFPDAKAFILTILKNGEALILFDGLDEVREENNQRSKIISEITKLANSYPNISMGVSCRVAATEYVLEHFDYFEIAPFNEEQIKQFASLWFTSDKSKLELFLEELQKPEHQGLWELASTPLLLSLLCLAYDEIGYFPTRRVDLYKDALDALMRKWDASRGIKRDEIYRKLSIVRKEQLLTRIAAKYFESGTYFFEEEVLAKEISQYVEQLPPIDIWESIPDGVVILKSIEAQHGLLIERAHGIYSFLHLTFQEYFTARYIVDNSTSGAIDRLVTKYLTNSRWNEVFLMTASLLSDGNEFFTIFLDALANIVIDDNNCVALINWIERKVALSKWPDPTTRGILLHSIIIYYAKNNLDPTRELSTLSSYAYRLATELSYDQTASALGLTPFHFWNRIQLFESRLHNANDLRLINYLGINIKKSELDLLEEFSKNQIELLRVYIQANLLFLECLQLAWLSNRTKIGEKFLLLPKVIRNK